MIQKVWLTPKQPNIKYKKMQIKSFTLYQTINFLFLFANYFLACLLNKSLWPSSNLVPQFGLYFKSSGQLQKLFGLILLGHKILGNEFQFYNWVDQICGSIKGKVKLRLPKQEVSSWEKIGLCPFKKKNPTFCLLSKTN